MRYDRALTIGTEVEGIIKCTWAMVYDERGNKLFALQAHRYSVPVTGVTEKYWLSYDNGSGKDGVDTNNMYLLTTASGISEAVVTADKYVYDYKVPVRLNQQIIEFLQLCINQEQRKLNNYQAQWDRANDPGLNSTLKTDEYRARLYEAIEKQKQKIQTRRKQMEQVQNGGYFYVKPKAFEWFPLNTKGLNGDLKNKQQALRTAQMILAVSAASTII